MKNKNVRTGSRTNRKSRRGSTLVFVAILMTVAMMFAGFGIDFSRMYTYKAQLKVLADAASLSGVMDLKNGATEANAKTRAVALRTNNKVDGAQLATLPADSVIPCTWTGSMPCVPATWSNANAVRAAPTYLADWSIARVFGVTNRNLHETSVAALGSYVSSACLAPIAIPYSNLLRALNPLNTDTSYVLTQADIATLAANNTEIQLTGTQDGDGDMLSPGWFALINIGTGNGSNQDVRNALDNALDGCQTGLVVNTGDWLDVVPGTGGYNSNQQRWRDLCDGTNQMTNCTRTLQIPVVNSWNGSSGTGAAWRVVYVAAIRITRIIFPTGASSPAEVHGYFTVDNQGGGSGFSTIPGPVQGIAIVH